jgi:hypothetical protein
MPSVRLALAIFVVGNAVLAVLAYRGYQSLLDYCEDSPEVAMGGDSLSCLEPQHWFTVQFALLVLLLFEIAVAVVVGAAVVRSRRRLGSELQ